MRLAILTPEQTDIVRWLFLGLTAFLVSVAFNIVFIYATLPRRSRSRALMRHIIFVGSSYLTLILVGSFDTLSRLEEPINYKLPMRLVAICLGLFGLWQMNLHLKYERRAVRSTENDCKLCNNCGSTVVDVYCALCGTKQEEYRCDTATKLSA